MWCETQLNMEKKEATNIIRIYCRTENDMITLCFEDTGRGGVKQKPLLNKDSYGLGIPFLKRIAPLVPGGRIRWIDKVYESGTIVEFTFQNTVSIDVHNDTKEQKPSLDLTRDEKQWINKLRLHIIDDSLIVQKCISRQMMSINVSWADTTTYVNAEQFVDHVAHALTKYDVVMVDQNMETTGGVMKGTCLCKLLLKQRFQGLLIVITGNPEEAMNKVKRKYMDRIIVWTKPLPGSKIIMDVLHSFYSE